MAPTRMAVTPRREFLRRLGLGTTIVLVGNLGGVTSSALSLVPSLARAGRLDVLYPVNGYKRQVRCERVHGWIKERAGLILLSPALMEAGGFCE